MEKIAILTHSVAHNFGANLQALSTACYLKNHNYHPVFHQWGAYLPETISEQDKMHVSFLKDCGFKMSEPLESDNDFLSFLESEEIKRIIVGSDCVLTYDGSRFPFRLTRRGFVRIKKSQDYEFPNPFWLPFLFERDGYKRALMSASTGGASAMKIKEGHVTDRMKNLLNSFNYISVRDTFTQKFVCNLLPLRKDVVLTPDPVFGFNNNVKNVPSEEDIRNKYGIEGKYFIISFYQSCWPNQDWADSIMKEAHKEGVVCVSTMMPQGGRNSNFDIDIELPLNPLEWYALIKYSNGYIGNNMHPIIVAIHNKVPFYSFNIHGRSYLHGRIQLIRTSKEYDLLHRFGLHNNVAPQPFLRFISPKHIINKLNSFDMKKCEYASDFMQQEYEHMMSDILESLVGG